jgi:hypothetical protein
VRRPARDFLITNYLRRFEEAKSDIQQAMLLGPRDPEMSRWFNLSADPELGLGRFDKALEDVKWAVYGGYRNIYSYINLAAAHAFKGEMDEAEAAMAEARRLKPDLSVKWLVKHKPVPQLRSTDYARPGCRSNERGPENRASLVSRTVPQLVGPLLPFKFAPRICGKRQKAVFGCGFAATDVGQARAAPNCWTRWRWWSHAPKEC